MRSARCTAATSTRRTGRTCCRAICRATSVRDFRGERLDRALLPKAQPRIPLFHSVGGLDPLEQKDVEKPLGDGLPETLPEWIAYSGLVRIKIKLSGEDLAWDVDRTLAIDRDRGGRAGAPRRHATGRIASTSTSAARTSATCSSACAGSARDRPAGFERILYVEQPTRARSEANRAATSCTRRRSCGRSSSTNR